MKCTQSLFPSLLFQPTRHPCCVIVAWGCGHPLDVCTMGVLTNPIDNPKLRQEGSSVMKCIIITKVRTLKGRHIDPNA